MKTMKPKINRYPKMAAIQKARAEALGFPEPNAKIIGAAQALKYAIFKQKRYAAPKRRGRGKNASWDVPNKGITVDPIFKLYVDKETGLPYVGGKIISLKDYEKALSKFPNEVRKAIETWASNIIQKVPTDILKNETQFFNKVWKAVRDQDPITVLKNAA